MDITTTTSKAQADAIKHYALENGFAKVKIIKLCDGFLVIAYV